MVWFALMFVTRLGFGGLALEFNRWENIGTRVQKAADAAALAGAVFLPDNLTQAVAAAGCAALAYEPADGGLARGHGDARRDREVGRE